MLRGYYVLRCRYEEELQLALTHMQEQGVGARRPGRRQSVYWGDTLTQQICVRWMHWNRHQCLVYHRHYGWSPPHYSERSGLWSWDTTLTVIVLHGWGKGLHTVSWFVSTMGSGWVPLPSKTCTLRKLTHNRLTSMCKRSSKRDTRSGWKKKRLPQQSTWAALQSNRSLTRGEMEINHRFVIP